MIKNFFLIFIKVIKLFYEFCGDLWLFCLYSNRGLKISKKNHLEYFILIEAHRIEKGLSLPMPKPFFGRVLFKNLSSMIYSLQKISSIDIMEVKKAYNALNSYLDMHKEITDKNNKEQNLFLNSLHDLNQFIKDNTKFTDPSSALKITNQNLLSELDFRKKLINRSSSRRFSKNIIKKDVVKRIIEVAQKAPSQCNRQTSRAHLIQNKEKINNILSIQGGTAGYKEYINNLFIVSGDLGGWQGPQQRNQVYVDGALFSMMLMLGIQSEKLVSCSLNLAIKNSDEKRIKIIGSIPKSERLIMLVAFGEAENSTKNIVASSPRRKINEVFSSE